MKIDIQSYVLEVTREGHGTFIDDGAWGSATWYARIKCTGTHLDGTSPIRLYFVDRDKLEIDNVRSVQADGTSWLSLFLDRSQYEWCVDMLRNESPVLLIWYEDYRNASYLTTVDETPGEGE